MLGECAVTIEDSKGLRELVRLGRGQYFGEQALLNDAPRTATVSAVGDGCVVLELLRFGFEKSVTSHIQTLLGEVPLLASLEPSKRSYLSKGMKLMAFLPGQVIITEGDVGDAFYIVENGECIVNVSAVRPPPGTSIRTTSPGVFCILLVCEQVLTRACMRTSVDKSLYANKC